jgi:putative acyl-CoA dehydrogenase
MSDLFLVLAQAPEGISCFAMPRILPDGSRNRISVERLKEKLGNRSNASSEVEYNGALARMVGEPGRGVPTIIEMVAHTRLDCVFGAAAGMRSAVAQATWHAAHRAAFGKQLIDQPLMTNVLADLALESEATTVLAMRLARAYDEADGDPAAACELGKRMALEFWDARAIMQQPLLGLEEAVGIAKNATGRVVLVDAADATSSGASGDSNAILAELIRQGCTRTALVPIVATSFGLPAVVLVGAFAYLFALPAFFSVIMPLQPQATGAGRSAVA